MFLDLFDTIKLVMVQPIIPYSSVVSFNICIFLRVTWLDKHEFNTFNYSPGGKQAADVFSAIIAAWLLGSDALFNDLI